jgi:hypothetical protein
MLMPFASVTLIGLLGAVTVLGSRRWPPAVALGRGLAGAWAGFVVGAIVGLAIDIVSHDGVYVAVVGHLGAVAGTAAALRRRRAWAHPAQGRRL